VGEIPGIGVGTTGTVGVGRIGITTGYGVGRTAGGAISSTSLVIGDLTVGGICPGVIALVGGVTTGKSAIPGKKRLKVARIPPCPCTQRQTHQIAKIARTPHNRFFPSFLKFNLVHPLKIFNPKIPTQG